MLQCLRKQGTAMSHMMCIVASAGGHLNVLQWAQEQGCT